MSSASSKPSEATPAPPTFSYAQAAKGRAPSITPSAVLSSQTTSGVSTPHKDTLSTSYTPSAGSERGVESVNGSHEAISRSDVQADISLSESKSSNPPKPVDAEPSQNPDISTSPTLAKDTVEDDYILVGNITESTRERSGQPINTTEKFVEEKEGRRSKKGKKQKNTDKEVEKEKEEVKPEVFVPAPIPTVNFWLQRKEEAAKTKPITAHVQPPRVVAEPLSEVVKPAEPKKRGKSTGGEEREKATGISVNGVNKEPLGLNRTPKKGGDNNSKAKDEQANKRVAPRGSRGIDKDDKAQASQVPPPVEDAISWPTPETALEEEKRKAQEKADKEEKEDASANKQPRPKEKWVTVPYIPTVTFNTPLPQRGGRGRGGARAGRIDATGRMGHAGTNTSSEKSAITSTTASSPPAENRANKDASVRAASLPPGSNRSPEQSTLRNQRRPGGNLPLDKSRADKSDSVRNEAGQPVDSRVQTGNARIESGSTDTREQNVRSDDTRALRSDQIQNVSDGQSQSKSIRQHEFSAKASDVGYGKENGQTARDRVDGRMDRGRGGFRGRGGHNTALPNGQHTFSNGHAPPPPNGFPPRSSTGPYSPPLQQPFNSQYGTPARGGRGGNPVRAQSIPTNGGMYSQFRSNGAPPQHMVPLQTTHPMYEYPMHGMSAGPYNPYIDSVSLHNMVTMQLEYYFSIDNLCKDVYLRKHMDSQGYVYLSFIAGFKRIQSLTHDFELLKYACQESEVIDLVRGPDGVDRLRRKEGWEKWVLALEERDEAARNPGPEYVLRPYPTQRGQQIQQIMSPNHHTASPAFSPNGAEQAFRPFENGPQIPQMMNGNGSSFHPETPLSAAVPDFAPGLLPVNGTNDPHDPLEAEITFNDEEVANLTLVFASPKGSEEDPKPKTPFHNSSSRTFSNGSIDSRSIAEEIYDEPRQSRSLRNGVHIPESSPEDLRRSRSPFTPLSPAKSSTGISPPVMWVKGQRQQTISEHNTEELYTDFRARALNKRDLSAPGETHADMKLLYEFWSHFLCRNFNLTMYNEFRHYALADAGENAMSGIKNLVSYYDEVLNSKKKVIPETLASHYVEIVKGEAQPDRPAFEKLRAAWRNGALDMKSRKKIADVIDSKLREELDDRAPRQKSFS